MKANPVHTFNGSINSDESARRFRDQATGVPRRSQRVIDCAPPSQLKVADRSYPSPSPLSHPATGRLYDRMSGRFTVRGTM